MSVTPRRQMRELLLPLRKVSSRVEPMSPSGSSGTERQGKGCDVMSKSNRLRWRRNDAIKYL